MGVFALAGSYEPAIDSKKACGRENHLCGDQAGGICLDAKGSPKTVGYEKQDKSPTRVFGVECQQQRTGHAGCATCPLQGIKSCHFDHAFLATLVAGLSASD